MRRRGLWIVVILVVFLGLPAFLAWNFLIGPILESTTRYRALIGQPESQAIRVLGEPLHRETAAQVKDKGIDYPWRDKHYVPIPERPVHREVWLYEERDRSGDPMPFALYVFIGEDGRVEAIDMAGK